MTAGPSTRIAFDASYQPPAPVLPIGIGGIDSGSPTTMVRMLVDTGADCTLIPVHVARALRLPLVDRVELCGVGAVATVVSVHAARVLIAGMRVVARLMAFEDEALLGRDILNRLSLEIDGPGGWLSVGRKPAPKRTRK
ncbi:MAG: retroviral-like aspartic protease family protein [Polyangiales bacterium]